MSFWGAIFKISLSINPWDLGIVRKDNDFLEEYHPAMPGVGHLAPAAVTRVLASCTATLSIFMEWRNQWAKLRSFLKQTIWSGLMKVGQTSLTTWARPGFCKTFNLIRNYIVKLSLFCQLINQYTRFNGKMHMYDLNI